MATCEEHGNDDPTFGYLGIYPSTWQVYGGGQYADTAGGATWDEQVSVANRIEGGYVPDQNGVCEAW